mgnify:CR=1 FL=1
MSSTLSITPLSSFPSMSLDLIPPTSYKELYSRITFIALESLAYLAGAFSVTFAISMGVVSMASPIGAFVTLCGLISTLFCLSMSVQLLYLYVVAKRFYKAGFQGYMGLSFETDVTSPRKLDKLCELIEADKSFSWSTMRRELLGLSKR